MSGKTYDLVDAVLNEELAKFPFCPHDDLLDVLAYAAIGIDKKTMTPIQTDNASSKALYQLLTDKGNEDQLLRQ